MELSLSLTCVAVFESRWYAQMHSLSRLWVELQMTFYLGACSVQLRRCWKRVSSVQKRAMCRTQWGPSVLLIYIKKAVRQKDSYIAIYILNRKNSHLLASYR